MADLGWLGDLSDDCRGAWGEYTAHAEDMGDHWWCAVTRGAETVFHSGTAGIIPLTGDAARRLCELVVRAELGGRDG